MRSHFPAKVMIFGRPGSGKSTFALQLHRTSQVPLYHLDKHFFGPNWIERDYQEFLAIQQSILATDTWIIDGNNTQSLEMRYSKADLVLYFNYPKWLCYWRILKRWLSKNRDIDDRAPGCKETIRLSLLRYMWSFEERVAKQISLLKEQYPNTRFMEINNDRALKALQQALISNPS